MKKKVGWALLLSGLLGIIVIVGVYFSLLKEKYFHSIPLTFGTANTPYADVEVAGDKYQFLIDFGSKLELAMRKPFLDRINEKQPHGIAEWQDLKGRKYETPAYVLPYIKLGALQFNKVVVHQTDDDDICNSIIYDQKNKTREELINAKQGIIGRPLLTKNNLLLDFGRSLMIFTNDLKRLDRLGYNISSFTQVPFEVGRMGPVLLVDTDLGQKKFSVDTGATASCIRASELKDVECTVGHYGIPYFLTSKFNIGGSDLGEVILYEYDITTELEGIDGFLGMSFLEDHIMYLDFPNKIAYIKKKGF